MLSKFDEFDFLSWKLKRNKKKKKKNVTIPRTQLKKNDRNLSIVYIKLLLIIEDSETRKERNIHIFSANLLFDGKHLENSFSLRDKYLHCARLENRIFPQNKTKKKKKKKKEEYIIAQRMQSLITGVKQRFPV